MERKYFFFQLRAHARQVAQLLLAADAFQIIHRFDAVMFVEQRDAFRAKPLNLQQFEGRCRILCKHLVAAVERSALADFS